MKLQHSVKEINVNIKFIDSFNKTSKRGVLGTKKSSIGWIELFFMD
ncbi:hypothetical protein [Xanthomarina gelatinilytica]